MQAFNRYVYRTALSLISPHLTSPHLTSAYCRYKIQLKELEDQLLEKLANAPEDILSDVPLIEGLEATKEKATEINAAVIKGKQTEVGINEAREVYRPVSSHWLAPECCILARSIPST